MKIPVTVHGAEGRMGRLVTELVAQANDCELVALVTEPGREQPAGAFHPDLALTGQDHLAAIEPAGGVIVDFSLATALDGLLAGAAVNGAGLVIGTTGYTEDQKHAIASYARGHPVVHAANFSAGIGVLKLVLEQLARLLPEGFDVEQVETHHRHKVDRPSGTAADLASAWQKERGGTRPVIHSLRVGGVTGEHAWTISDENETLQVVHRAHSRRAFLRGILPSVRFAFTHDRGLYGLADVLAAGS